MPRLRAYAFTVWFRDHSLTPDEQDYEWPACFEVLAAASYDALAWGAHLSGRYAERQDRLTVLRCTVEALPAGPSGRLPLIRHGEEATDREIGW